MFEMLSERVAFTSSSSAVLLQIEAPFEIARVALIIRDPTGVVGVDGRGRLIAALGDGVEVCVSERGIISPPSDLLDHGVSRNPARPSAMQRTWCGGRPGAH